jgi:hypothetical protein
MVTGGNFNYLAAGGIENNVLHRPAFVFPQQMRAIPTTLDYANIGLISAWGAGVQSLSSLTYNSVITGVNSVALNAVPSSALGTAGGVSYLIGNNNSSGFIAFGAEL